MKPVRLSGLAGLLGAGCRLYRQESASKRTIPKANLLNEKFYISGIKARNADAMPEHEIHLAPLVARKRLVLAGVQMPKRGWAWADGSEQLVTVRRLLNGPGFVGTTKLTDPQHRLIALERWSPKPCDEKARWPKRSTGQIARMAHTRRGRNGR